MTLIISSIVAGRIAVTVDSFLGQTKDGGARSGDKVLLWSAEGLLLTAYGDFDMAPTELQGEAKRLGDQFALATTHGERSNILLQRLNADAHIHAQGGKEATCLLYGFEAGAPVVSVLFNQDGAGAWQPQGTVAPNLLAGYLEPLGLKPSSGRCALGRAFDDEATFEAWSHEQIDVAHDWLRARGYVTVIMPPARTYYLG